MFLLTKLIAMLADPSNLLILGFIAAVILLRWRGRPVIVLELICLLYVAVWVTPLTDWMVLALEQKYPMRPPLPEKVDGIIVLGGWQDMDEFERDGLPAMQDSGERIVTAVGLARRYPNSKLLVTGGSGAMFPGSRTEADATRVILQEIGFPLDRVIFEDRSRTTLENAQYSAALIKPQPGQTWILVTTAMHMPRGKACFDRVGWSVIPYGCDYRGSGAWFRDRSFGSALQRFFVATYEWAGLIVYRAMGRID